MNKHFILPLCFILFFLSSCSVQKNISPQIFTQRITEKSTDFIIENQAFYYKDDYIVFADYKGFDVVIKLKTDENNNICKLCLSIVENIKTEELEDLISIIIDVYTPDEQKDIILNELHKEASNYYQGKEHIYSLINDKNIYFEVIDIPLSGYTYPELTLKSNDRMQF